LQEVAATYTDQHRCEHDDDIVISHRNTTGVAVQAVQQDFRSETDGRDFEGADLTDTICPTGHQHSGRRALSELAAEFIGCFQDIDILNAPCVEPAMLAPFCAPGDLLNISGPAGCGKTSIATDILLAAAHPGRHGVALGGAMRFTEPSFGTLKCAVMDAETSKGRWDSMLARKCAQEGLCPEDLAGIRYLRASDFGLGQPSARAEHSLALAEALGRDQRRLAIIDTLAMTWAPRDMNNPDWVFDGLAPFRAECKNRGVTVIALTHTRRPTRDGPHAVGPIGTSYQENQADTQLIVSRLKGSTAGIRMTATKSRRAFWIQQGALVELRFTPNLGYEPIGNALDRWPHEWPGADAAVQPEAIGSQMLIERMFRENGAVALTTKEIATAHGLSDRAVRSHCRALANRGIIARIGNGPSSAWRCARQ
jgi:hypothetical protein